MNRLLTTLLVWLLMAALPLHAMAASANMSCAPVRQHDGMAQMVEHAAHNVAHNVTHTAVTHTAAQAAADDAHAHPGSHDMASPAAAGVQGSDDAEVEQLTHSSCSACSAFCVGAIAPPSCSLSLPSFDGSEAPIARPGNFVAGFIPDGLHRPPRP